MYLKLMARGLLRHRASGKRLFVLLALCSAAITFCLYFRDSFALRYRDLAIDLSTAHLQILPIDSPKAKDEAFGGLQGDLALMEYGPRLESWLRSRPGFVAAGLCIETSAAVFSLGGEQLGGMMVKSVDADMYAAVLPGARVVEGKEDFSWKPGDPEASILVPQRNQGQMDKDEALFVRSNFRPKGEAWEAFKARAAKELAALFPSGLPLSDEAFLKAVNAALDREDLSSLLPSRSDEDYDYRVDDAIADLDAAQEPETGASAAPARQLRILRKRLLQSLYPDAITPVRQEFAMGVPYTLALPPARSADPLAMPKVLAARHGGYYRSIPLYGYEMLVDAAALRDALGLGPRQGTALFLRLESVDGVAAFKSELQDWIARQGLPLIVKDYLELGKLYAATTTAFLVMTLVLIVLMAATAMIFVGNSVYLSLLKRRREIGTAIALGLGPGGNAAIMLGEAAVLTIAAWALGAFVATALDLAFGAWGMPGLPFFPDGKLYFAPSLSACAISLALMLVVSLSAAALPLRSLRKARPVELLKEAS